MQMMMLYIVIGLACILVLRGVWKTMNWLWFKPKKLERRLRQEGLVGNPYRLLSGDMKESSRMLREARQSPIPFTNDYYSRVFPFRQKLANKYGGMCFLWLGPTPSINITDPELIRDSFTRMQEFQKPLTNPLIALITPGLTSYEGEKWKQHRKLVNPAFHMEKLKLMLPAFSISITETIDKWEKLVSRTGSCEVDVWPYLITLSADVISRAAFGSSYAEGRKIFELLTEQIELTLRLIQSVYIPGWKYVPTKNHKRMKEMNAEIEASLKGIIDKRRKAIEAGNTVNDDLLGILLDSNFEESRGNNKTHLAMSFQDLIAECKLFYFAGQETTSVLLVWTMILLSKHQDWQERAREEVLTTFGKSHPNFDGLNHLKIVTMILYEVLRLYPPIPTVSRKINQSDTRLGDLCLPAGVVLGLSILHAHHDPKLWGDDAKEFKPERFSEGIAKATKGNISFFPFGWGPRLCVGQNFTLLEAKMALAMIMRKFRFELSPAYTHAPISVISLKPQFGAHVILHQI